jgi:octaprenyl-diphosphate synthase
MEIMADATNVIAEGEVLQLMNAQDPDTTEERYLEVIYRKTAQLFESGAQVAAVLCGANPRCSRPWPLMANTWARPTSSSTTCWITAPTPPPVGKNLGDDLAEGKPTLPLIHALRHASEADRGLIRNAILHAGEGAQREGDLKRIIAAIDASDGIGYARGRAEAESRAAMQALESVPESRWRDALADLARIAVGRDR